MGCLQLNFFTIQKHFLTRQRFTCRSFFSWTARKISNMQKEPSYSVYIQWKMFRLDPTALKDAIFFTRNLLCSIFRYLFRIFKRGGTFRRHGWHTISATRPLVRPTPAGKAEEEHDWNTQSWGSNQQPTV